LPANLSLAELSRHYDVSITPVRDAIELLVDEGYLTRKGNRRIEVNPSRIGIGDGEEWTSSRPKLPEDWDEVLLDEVMHASLNLAAVYLRETSLAEKYGVGRSIVRGVFSRFSGAGLLDHVPRRGWRVQPVQIEDVRAYLSVRAAMELLALDQARPNVNEAEITALLEGEYHALNNATHRYFIEKSGNRYIDGFFRQFVSRFYTKMLYYAAPEARVVEEMANEHVQILEAVLADDWQRAREVMSKHILNQRAILERVLVARAGVEKQP
jgi:DNA-binding GntR family transcriptional regulator